MTVDGNPPTSALADVLSLRGVSATLSPPLTQIAGRVLATRGVARTVRFDATEVGEGGTFDELYALLDDDLSGQTVVVAGAEGVDGAIWGQILSVAARRSGAVAVLVAGNVRDVRDLASSDLPVWALGVHTMGATGLARVTGVDVQVSVGAVVIGPGDVIVTDAGGAVAVPAAMIPELLDDASVYAAAEQRLLADLGRGIPLADAYEHKRAVRQELERS